MKARDPRGVLEDFQKVSELVLNRTLAPILYYYLVNGVDPNEWLGADQGYKRYEKTEDAPIFWLSRFTDSGSGLTLSEVALSRMEQVKKEVKERIDRETEARELENAKRILAETDAMAPFSIKGTPFDKDWEIKPPGSERH